MPGEQLPASLDMSECLCVCLGACLRVGGRERRNTSLTMGAYLTEVFSSQQKCLQSENDELRYWQSPQTLAVSLANVWARTELWLLHCTHTMCVHTMANVLDHTGLCCANRWRVCW